MAENNIKMDFDFETLESDIAVVVLTYNQESILHECLESILSQKLKMAKLIVYVIDDASTDGTRDVIDNFKNMNPGRVIPILYEKNQYQRGYAPEFQILNKINSPFISFCDGDDFWVDELKIEKQLDAFSNDQNLAIVHTDYYLGKRNDTYIEFIPRSIKERGKADKIKNSFDLIQGNDIKKSTAVFRKSSINFDLIDNCKGIRAQDWVMAVGAGANGTIKYLDDPTTCYRLNDEAAFQTLSQREKVKIKDEVRWFCATNLSEGELRDAFRRFIIQEEIRKILSSSQIYRLIRPLFIFSRKIKSKLIEVIK